MQAPTYIGRYRLIKPLGSGSSASVYVAVDDHAPRGEREPREVALKVRARQAPSPKESFLEARFKEGARLQGWLCHPHVVWQYESLEGPSYQALALELLGGGTLQDYLKRSPTLSERALCALAFALCDALDHLHDVGVIHRDLKPENILLSNAPLWGDSTLSLTPKISDFDVSRHPLYSPHITSAGSQVGTLWYTSPEQFDQASPTPRDDVYSLGVTLFECAAKQLPFEPLNSASIFKRFLDHEPLRPLRQLRPELSEGFMWLVERAASVLVEERPPSASTLALLLLGCAPSISQSPRAYLMARRADHAWLREHLSHAPHPVQAQLTPALEAMGLL